MLFLSSSGSKLDRGGEGGGILYPSGTLSLRNDVANHERHKMESPAGPTPVLVKRPGGGRECFRLD